MVVGRQGLIDSGFSTVVCAPIYSAYHGLSSQVPIGIHEGLKHDCSIHCDELMSLRKAALTDFVGSLSLEKQRELDFALARALALLRF